MRGGGLGGGGDEVVYNGPARWDTRRGVREVAQEGQELTFRGWPQDNSMARRTQSLSLGMEMVSATESIWMPRKVIIVAAETVREHKQHVSVYT